MSLALFNRIEALIWFAMAAALLIRLAVRRRARERGLLMTVIPALLLFGISDLIEARTGAWWRPWPLLLLKAGCVLVLGCCLFAAWRGRNSRDG